MEDLFEINAHRQAVQENIEKAFTSGINMNEEIEKARSGIYADTAENRKLARVGQQYGSKKQPEQKNEKNVNSDKEKLAKEFIENAKKEFEKKFPGMKFDINSSAKSDKDSKEDDNKEKDFEDISTDIDSIAYRMADNPKQDESGNKIKYKDGDIQEKIVKEHGVKIRNLVEKYGKGETISMISKNSDAFDRIRSRRLVNACLSNNLNG